MKKSLAPTLRRMWMVFGVVMAVVLTLTTVADGLIFFLAYGSSLGSYAGQAGDRHRAVLIAVSLAGLWAFLGAAVLWPALRWRRRGTFASAEGPGK